MNSYTLYTGVTEKAWLNIWKDKKLTDKLTNVTSDLDFAFDYSYNFENGNYENIAVEISNIPLEAFISYRLEDYEEDNDFHSFTGLSEINIHDIISNETLFLLNLLPFIELIEVKKISRK